MSSMSSSELREQLSAIEPDEHTYEGIGPEDVGALREFLMDEEAWLAARAVHALSRIDADSARDALVSAAESPRMEVRVAVASSAGALPARLSDTLLSRLLEDAQPAVRKFAIQSTSHRSGDSIRRRISEIAATEANERLRESAAQKARSFFRP